jgi:hypothetical protein
LQRLLDDLLSEYNARDHELVAQRRHSIEEALRDELEAAVHLRFGGSVAKHTYVDGLSDIDTLVVLRKEDASGLTPTDVKEAVAKRLSQELKNADVKVGKIAVTISYFDGMEVQLIPAIKDMDQIKIPSWSGNKWSRINPEAFTEALTRRNEQCNFKLVPTIKLAKAINATLADSHQLSGYHIESLAIDVFRRYTGPCTTAVMLSYFMERIPQKVLKPIKDSTGQSVHVDSYLGKSNSEQRQMAAHLFERLLKRMKAASSAQSDDLWKSMFYE